MIVVDVAFTLIIISAFIARSAYHGSCDVQQRSFETAMLNRVDRFRDAAVLVGVGVGLVWAWTFGHWQTFALFTAVAMSLFASVIAAAYVWEMRRTRAALGTYYAQSFAKMNRLFRDTEDRSAAALRLRL